MAVTGASQSGRASRRNQGTTPARNISPSRHGTRSGSTAPQATPGTRRSARHASQQPEQTRNIVSNAALPEIQTRQSYAYGSSKAPQLPEQLYARGTMSMQQVANQMNADIDRAQKNLVEHADVQDDGKAKEQARLQQLKLDQEAKARDDELRNQNDIQDRLQKQQKARQTTPVSQTTEVQKQRRTAAWASSLDDSPLDHISEEPSPVDTPETRRTEPSSFPSGIFDHSYAYERGMRAPRAERRPSAISQFFSKLWEILKTLWDTTKITVSRVREVSTEWLRQLVDTALQTLIELPQSTFFAAMLKSFYVLCLMVAMSMAICLLYTNYLCDANSTSQFSQALQNLCGGCRNTQNGSWDFNPFDSDNVHKLTSALNSLNSEINTVQSQLTATYDAKHALLEEELKVLRSQQYDFMRRLESLGHSAGGEVASPMIPQVNFFAPANGALVHIMYTSPTRSRVQSLPMRVAMGILGFKRYDVNGPATALLPWQDVGDCWCASATAPDQDSARLGVEAQEMIFPTELVIEHPPFGSTLSPDTAPREIELWANIEHLTKQQRDDLGIDSMRVDGQGVADPISDGKSHSFARLASVEYDASGKSKNHVQRFRLDVNQHQQNLKYSSRLFVVRVRSNHGADHSCLYRIRLHGVPVEESPRRTKFAQKWIEDEE